MTAIISALVSAFAIIAIGAAIDWRGWMDRKMWSGLEHIAYYVLFPALVVSALANADFSSIPVGGMVAVFLTAMAGMAIIVFAIRPLLLGPLGLTGPQFSSVFQGAFRWHTFLALAIISSAYGPAGIAIASIAVATIIPLANVASVVVITAHSCLGLPDFKRFLKIVFTNPFVLSSFLGIFMNAAGIPLIEPFNGILEILGKGATGIGLLVVGAGLRFRSLDQARSGAAISVCLKLLVMPAMVYGAALFWNVSGMPLAVALIAAAVPTATASYIMARQLGGDSEYVAGILTLQIIAATVTLPLVLWLGTS